MIVLRVFLFGMLEMSIFLIVFISSETKLSLALLFLIMEISMIKGV